MVVSQTRRTFGVCPYFCGASNESANPAARRPKPFPKRHAFGAYILAERFHRFESNFDGMVMPFAVPNLSMRVESSGVGRRSRGASNELAQSSGAPGEAVSQRHAFGAYILAGRFHRFGSNFASATHPFAMPNLPRRVEFWAHYRRSRSVSNESAQLSGCAGRRRFPTACLWRFQPGGTVPPF